MSIHCWSVSINMSNFKSELNVEGIVDVIEVSDPSIAHGHHNPLALVKSADSVHFLLGQADKHPINAKLSTFSQKYLKSNTFAFSAISLGKIDFGNRATPLCMCHLMMAWAVLLPYFLAISINLWIIRVFKMARIRMGRF